MSCFRWHFSSAPSPLRGITLAAVAVLLASGAAHAQIASSSNTPQASSSSSESSSLQYQFLSDDPDPALPAAPAASGGGQYDNRGGGGGSSHGIFHRLTWEAGGGFNAPAGNSGDYITWGGNITVGGGYRINPYLSLMTEYQFIDDKLPGAIIAETGATGGNAHIWSFTLDPVIDLMPKKSNSVYITGGGGFYRKVTNFTDPQEYEYCDYFYCGIGVENAVVGHFSSNQGGWSIGGGYTHKMGGIYGDGKTQLFAEARFLWVNTPAVTTEPNGLGTVGVAADTKLIPVTFGIRF